MTQQSRFNAHIGTSGIQGWSAGEAFPYVVFKREVWQSGAMIDARYIVSYAGVELAARATGAEADALALEFKAHNVRDAFDAQWHEALMVSAEQDAERFAVSRREGDKRQRNDYREMYGDPLYVPPKLSEVLRDLSVEAEGFRRAEAQRVAAREALERAADLTPDEHLDLYEFNAAQRDGTDVDALNLARRALGIIPEQYDPASAEAYRRNGMRG